MENQSVISQLSPSLSLTDSETRVPINASTARPGLVPNSPGAH